MQIEITYIADDGKEFDSEEECLEYESDLKKDMSSVIFFNEDRKIIKNPTAEDVEKDAYYMKILDAESACKLFDWFNGYICFNFLEETPIKDHFYRWVEGAHEDGWIDLTSEFDKLKSFIEDLSKEIEKKEG